VLKERADFLERALKNNWIVVFEHDVELAAARIGKEPGAHYAVREKITL
jgi:hypothetical protein